MMTEKEYRDSIKEMNEQQHAEIEKLFVTTPGLDDDDRHAVKAAFDVIYQMCIQSHNVFMKAGCEADHAFKLIETALQAVLKNYEVARKHQIFNELCNRMNKAWNIKKHVAPEDTIQ